MACFKGRLMPGIDDSRYQRDLFALDEDPAVITHPVRDNRRLTVSLVSSSNAQRAERDLVISAFQ
jgi:hypothetical protein